MFRGKNEISCVTTDSKGVRWPDLLLFATTLVVLFFSLGSSGLWGSEGRWAQVTREMFQNRDFFHPTINGEPYFDKPLLSYWFIVAISAITGSVNGWIIRLPSAIAGFITVWATVLLGRRLWSARVGSLAGWLLLVSYGILFWSRTAAAETENLAAITLCILWYWTRRNKPNFTTFVVFYVIAFLGAQTKGLPAVIVPILAILPDLVREKRWKILFRPSHILALIVGSGVYIGPFLFATMTRPEGYHSSGLALVFQENLQRYFKPFDHKEPFYLYFYAVPMLMLPWAPLFVSSVFGLVPIWKDLDRKTRWLIAAMGMIFLFFTLSGSRRGYYILPIVPLCALLMAVFWEHIVHERTKIARYWGFGIQKNFCLAFIIAQLAIPFILLFLKIDKNSDFYISFSISGIIIGGTASIVWFFYSRSNFMKCIIPKNLQRMTGLIAVAVITFGGFFCWQRNIMDRFRTERPFADKVKAETVDWASSSIGCYPNRKEILIYYLDLDGPLTILKTTDDWNRFVDTDHPRILLMQQKSIATVPVEYASLVQREPDIIEEVKPWDSDSSKKKKWAAWIVRAESVPSEVANPATNAEGSDTDEK